jgi:hypothetical protein
MPWRRIGEWLYRSTITNSTLDGGWVTSFTPRLLCTLGKRPSCPLDWVCPRASLKAVKKRKSLASAGNQTPAVQPVAVPTELPWIQTLCTNRITVCRTWSNAVYTSDHSTSSLPHFPANLYRSSAKMKRFQMSEHSNCRRMQVKHVSVTAMMCSVLGT